MSPEEEKQELTRRIKSLLLREYVQTDGQAVEQLQNIAKDIEEDFFTVVVLGEFKRGKSTFVNALIGADLLPADVLPTTATINALMYDEHKTAQIVMNDGSVERGTAGKDYLQQFSAGERPDVNQVRYIKIGCPAPILKNKVVLVDTPGVSDINDQRVRVTYDFIPKANAVIFLLDATAPLKNTEKEFIDSHLLSIGLDNIIFIANKYDEIDEEEDDDVLDETKRRMAKAFQDKMGKSTLKDIILLPLSAKQALQGVVDNNELLLAMSGIAEVKQTIQDILLGGTVSTEKIKRYKQRIDDVVQSIQKKMQRQIDLQVLSKEELQQTMERLQGIIGTYEKDKASIDAYVDRETKTILAMTDKSLICFHQKLKERIEDQVNFYNGTDFKEFIETQITKDLKRNMEAWVDAYSENINQLLINMEHSLAQGLAGYFNTQINLHSGFQTGMTTNKKFTFQLDAQDVSGATLQAGAISAGGAGLIMLIGGPVMLPFIGFLAYPLLQKKFLKDKLREAKSMILPVINETLIKSMCVLQDEVHKSIEERAACIGENTNVAYMSLLDKMSQQINDSLKEKEHQGDVIEHEINMLCDYIDELQQIRNQLR